MAASKLEVDRLNELLGKWVSYRASLAGSALYCQLKSDLYQVRNAGWDGNPSIADWPPDLVDSDDSIMAAVEHYCLCRCWVGNGKFPAWQMRALNSIYDLGKKLGVTPRHNPNKPTSKLTDLQMAAKEAGVRAGEADLGKSGGSAPLVAKPPRY